MCRLEPGGRFCEGCGRTLDEIRDWPGADEDRRRAIVRAAAGRRRTAKAPTTTPG